MDQEKPAVHTMVQVQQCMVQEMMDVDHQSIESALIQREEEKEEAAAAAAAAFASGVVEVETTATAQQQDASAYSPNLS